MTQLLLAGKWLLVALVLAGAVPLLVASYQFLLVALHFRRSHYRECQPFFPRTAILIPAWNEHAVIGTSIDRLMQLEYPRESLRIFVVDDASTDATPEVLQAKAAEYPGTVIPLRRDNGGEGKAAALNHGLAVILADGWMQAVLIMDADVVYVPSALRKMTRHLADPGVGSVTAYIKEGSQPGNYLTRFIGYEYITAQAAGRRSQDVLGVIACLAGGAQLHSRANIEAVGGRIDTTTLAEDTVTTFKTQLAGRAAIFEPHATVWAEEPGSIDGLWHQRLRWARGNIQVTGMFRHVWFRHQAACRLGSISFGLLWFCLLLLPALMVSISASLVALYFIDFPLAWTTFRALWLINVITYVFITSFALLIDPAVGKRGLAPGRPVPRCRQRADHRHRRPARAAWLGLSPASYCQRHLRDHGLDPRLGPVHLHLAGRLHGRRLPGEGCRVAPAQPAAQPGPDLHRRLRAAALRDRHGRLRPGIPRCRPALGEDREDRQSGGDRMTAQPDPPRQPPAARVAEPPAPESADKTAALAPASRGRGVPWRGADGPVVR